MKLSKAERSQKNYYVKQKLHKNSSYAKGKRWGFAIMRAAAQTSKGAVMQADKAMQTCAKYAESGYKCKQVKLTQHERAAYKGAADGIYEYVKKNSK